MPRLEENKFKADQKQKTDVSSGPMLLENTKISNLFTRKSDIVVLLFFSFTFSSNYLRFMRKLSMASAVKAKLKNCKTNVFAWTLSCVFSTGRSVDDVIRATTRNSFVCRGCIKLFSLLF